MGVAFPLDLEGEARGAKFHQPETVVTDVAVVVCLDVASSAIWYLELPLNDEIGTVQPGRISGVIAGIIFGLERDLAIVTGFGGGDVFCVKSHEARSEVCLKTIADFAAAQSNQTV